MTNHDGNRMYERFIARTLEVARDIPKTSRRDLDVKVKALADLRYEYVMNYSKLNSSEREEISGLLSSVKMCITDYLDVYQVNDMKKILEDRR